MVDLFLIRKHEAIALMNMGLGEFIKHSYSRNRKYYVVENRKPLTALDSYRGTLMN